MKQRVPTVEEIIALKKAKENLQQAACNATGPITVEAPEPITSRDYVKGQAIRISTPPVSTEPTDQTPIETLSQQEARRDLPKILEEEGVDPVKELLKMYKEVVDDPDSPFHGKPAMPAKERRMLMMELVKYIHPQLKSVDHKGMVGSSVTVILNMPDGSRSATTIEARGKVIDG